MVARWDCDFDVLVELEVGGWAEGEGKERPVMKEESWRMKTDRQRMARVTLAGRECHERMVVPMKRRTRLVVIM